MYIVIHGTNDAAVIGDRCIGSLVAELDAPWAGYVEGVERLARPDADNALRELEAKVSEAILHALENQVILENKVSNMKQHYAFCFSIHSKWQLVSR